MGFVNPALLAGIGLFSVPIIIHLLMRRKVIEMEWAAMQFLKDIIEEQQRRITIEELLLLLLRTLMILFLALAVSRPVLKSDSGQALLGGSADVALVLDSTFSMDAREGAESRWDRAKEKAISVLDELPKTFGVSVVLGSAKPEPIIRQFSEDHDLLVETIKGQKVGSLSGDASAMISAAASQMQRGKQPVKRIYLFSDFQSRDWGTPEQPLKTAIQRLAADAKIVFVPIEDGLTENVSAADLRLPSDVVRTGGRTVFTGVLQNHGEQDATDVAVDLLVDDSVVESATVSLMPGQKREIRLPYVAMDPGRHRAVLHIRHDNLQADNDAYLPFVAGDEIPVLGVAEAPPAVGEPTALDFVELCLNPYEKRSDDPRALYRMRKVGGADLITESLDQYELVVLANLAGVTSGDARHLEEYVRGGGGVLMFLGRNTRADFFNENLYRNGEGLMAWPLAEKVLKNDDDEKPLVFDAVNPDHAVWGDLLVDEDRYFQLVRFYAAYPFEKPEAPERAMTLATIRRDDTQDVSPMILDCRLGRGHAVFVGSSGDLTMNNFAIRPVFVAFINQTVRYLRSFRRGQSVIRVGEGAERFVDFEHSQATYQFTTPSGEVSAISVLQEGEDYKLTLPTLTEAGFYQLVNDSDDEDRFSVAANIEPREGMIACLTPQELHTIYNPLGVTVVGAQGSDEDDLGSGLEFAALLLILMLLCWIGENLLAYRISKR